ncbi:MAG: RNase adapter RapZ [Bacilli bacterium]|nr:RNase adapter RapZ [Bacilli bacterium]
MNKLIILTGVSGAGKSTFAHVFEEKGYARVENVPEDVIPSFIESVKRGKDKSVSLMVAPQYAEEVILSAKKERDLKTKVIVLDCSSEELHARYRLTRHVHPLEATGIPLDECLADDKDHVMKVRKYADVYIDSTGLSSNQLRKIAHMITSDGEGHKMEVILTSFGYKYGVPQDAEVIFDTRIVPNPYWVKGLRDTTGLDKETIEFLDSQKETKEMMDNITSYLEYYLDKLEREGRNYVFIGIGCTGGQHRSVYFVEKLAERLSFRYNTEAIHRELHRFIKEPDAK